MIHRNGNVFLLLPIFLHIGEEIDSQPSTSILRERFFPEFSRRDFENDNDVKN
jgi:hypothetical protein